MLLHSTKLQFVIEQRRRELNRPMEDQDPGLVEKLDKLLEKLQKEDKAEGTCATSPRRTSFASRRPT